MGLIRSLRAHRLVLTCLLANWGAAAGADHSSICSNTALLKQAVQVGEATQTVITPVATLTGLADLSAEVRTTVGANAGTSLPALDATLSEMVAAIEDLDQDNGALGVALYQTLSRNKSALAQIEDMFGCSNPVPQTSGFQTPAPGPAVKVPSPGSSTEGTPGITFTANLWLIAGLVVLTIFAVWLIGRRKDRVARTICRTFAQLVHGKNCTITHFVDITRAGAKIEASEMDSERVWIRLYFCGHEVEGKVLWRNEFYAGIQFRSKISKQAFDDIILKSHQPLENSGQEEKALHCFAVGCHLDCPKHRPTALSLERLANENGPA